MFLVSDCEIQAILIDLIIHLATGVTWSDVYLVCIMAHGLSGGRLWKVTSYETIQMRYDKNVNWG